MALTRKMLKAMGIEDEKIDQIIEAHTDTVNALKDERDELKDKVSTLADVQKELEEVKKNASDSGKDAYKVKYEALKEEFTAFKNEVTANQTKAAKESAYKAMLKEIGVADKRIDSICKVTDFDSIEIDENGKIKDAENVTEAAKVEWADFIQIAKEKGADPANPPKNEGTTFSGMSITEKMTYANEHPNAPEVTAWLNGK